MLSLPKFKLPALSIDIDTNEFDIPSEQNMVEQLRTKFEIINNLYFDALEKTDIFISLKQDMVEISEKCLSDLQNNTNNEELENSITPREWICSDYAKLKSENPNRPRPDLITLMKEDNIARPNNFFIGETPYLATISHIKVFSCQNVVYKKIYFMQEDTNLFFKLVLEICLQKYALTIKCNAKIPTIIDYTLLLQKSVSSPFLVLLIKMEKLPIISFNGEETKSIEDKENIDNNISTNTKISKFDTIMSNHKDLIKQIKETLDCYETNNLYHNDTHSQNICFINENGKIKIAMIDFGKATLINNDQRYQTTTGFYKEIVSKEQFRKWLMGTLDDYSFEKRNYYGGKKRSYKNKKMRKTRKSKKTITRKNK
jgi:hypothetical protein